MLDGPQRMDASAARTASAVAAPVGAASRKGPESAQLALGLLSRRAPTLESDLHQALRGGQLRLHYQGQFDLGSGRLVALEALIRWAHPRDGLLSPAQFLPLAHDAGLMGAVDRWALRAACADGAWLASRGHPVEIAVNIGSAQLVDRGFVSEVAQTAERAGLPTELLTLELGQRDVLLDLAAASAVAFQLRLLGIRTSVSDVGAGSTSARDLQLLRADEIKIDRCLTAGLGDPDGAAAGAVGRVVGVARRLKARVVAEGIETDAQYDAARAAGCDRAQGFLLARPAALEDLAHILVRRAPAPGRPMARTTAIS
jgi:EAL domain-containing protein (putative c-di-GMP-specific phosphodiesterase class I)